MKKARTTPIPEPIATLDDLLPATSGGLLPATIDELLSETQQVSIRRISIIVLTEQIK